MENVEFCNFGIFHQFLATEKWPVWYYCLTVSFRFSKSRQNWSFLVFVINFCPLKVNVARFARNHSGCKSQKKVLFNIAYASEASYIYILSGQKLIKLAKNGPFSRSNSVTRQVTIIYTKIAEKCQNSNATFFQTVC